MHHQNNTLELVFACFYALVGEAQRHTVVVVCVCPCIILLLVFLHNC